MRSLFLFLSLFLITNIAFGQGDAPPLLKGQGQTAKTVGATIELPNNQVTKSGPGKALIETGNKNILTNPSFEASYNAGHPGWVQTGIVSPNVETTVVIDGNKSVDLSSPNQALDFHQDSTLYQAQFADGPQGLAMMRVKTTCTDAPIYVCPRTAGAYPSQKTSGCVQVQPTGKWKLYKIPFLLGGTSNGIGITSNGSAITCDTYIDDAFVGAVDLKQDVDQSRIAGWSYFPATSSCVWQKASTTLVGFTALAACPGPTVEYSSMGSWQTTDVDLPRQTINNLPAGVYKATFLIALAGSTATGISFAINDGTTTCVEQGGGAINTFATYATISCFFKYTSAGNRAFELYVSASSGITANLQNDSNLGTNRNTKFTLEYFGSGSIYSSTNADTDWAPCSFSTLAWNGLGTVTSPDLRCRRDGGELKISGKFTTGTVAASEARIPLPLWNGSQLSLSSSKLPSGLSNKGTWVRGASSGSHGGVILVTPSLQYLQMSGASIFGSTASSALATETGSNVASTGEVISIDASIPIDGWGDNSNIIIGQFNGLESCANSAQCETEYYADISSTGVVSGEEIDFINGNCTLSTNTYSCTFNTSQFAQAPTCSIKVGAGATQHQKLTEATSGFSYLMYNSTGTPQNVAASVSCRKRGSDYVTKTARAVASDQNIATPGQVKVKEITMTYGNSTGSAASPVVCSATPCSIYTNSSGSFSSLSWASTGVMQVTVANGTFAPNSEYECQCKGYVSGSGVNCVPYANGNQSILTNSSGGLIMGINSTSMAGVAANSFGIIKCRGIAP